MIPDDTATAEYTTFQVHDAASFYQLTVGGYSGTAGDSFEESNNRPFTTRDQDHDAVSDANCAVMYVSGWWHLACHKCQLTGQYFNTPSVSVGTGIQWFHYKGTGESLKTAVMAIW